MADPITSVPKVVTHMKDDAESIAEEMRTIAEEIVAKAMVHFVPGWTKETAQNVVTDAEKKRQRLEDVRANHRNKNRALTLVVALCFTFLVPFTFVSLGWIFLLKYATGIAIVPDALITLWAYVKKY